MSRSRSRITTSWTSRFSSCTKANASAWGWRQGRRVNRLRFRDAWSRCLTRSRCSGRPSGAVSEHARRSSRCVRVSASSGRWRRISAARLWEFISFRQRGCACVLALAALITTACRPAQRTPADTAWHAADGYRWRQLPIPPAHAPGFTSFDPSRTGITFRNTVSDSSLVQNRQLAQGAGVCLADVDGDGRPDVFLARTEGPNVLYRNLGDWRFEDITATAGVAAPDRYSTGCAFADIDGDGDQDLILVSLGGPNAIFVNDGKGHFTEETRGLTDRAGSMSIAVADVDGDGDLDLYIANYKAYTTLDRLSPQERAFGRVTRRVGPNRYEVREAYRKDYKVVERADLGGISLQQRADPDFFYRNDGRGHFMREPIARNPRFRDEQGRTLTEEREDFGLAAVFADLNGDGAPDLYVTNDFEDPDQLWLNDGHGRFRLIPWYGLRSTSNSGMAVAVGDVNADGNTDLFEADMLSRDTRGWKMEIPTNRDPARHPGIGDERPQMQRNTLQLNRGDGTFAEVARYAGVGRSGWSWSTLFLDVDLDGWPDILIGTGHIRDIMDGDTQYRLRAQLGMIDWRQMLLEYPPLPLPNVAFRNLGDLTFEDASEAWHFDLGADISHGMAVADLDGDGDLDVVINRLGKPAAVLRNDASAPRIAVRLRGEGPALFEDVSSQLGGHTHVDPYFDDYGRQLLLPNALSQLGPGVAWTDVDGDGREDLLVGAGRTGALAWFKNSGTRLRPAATRFATAPGDLTTVLGSPSGILAGVSSYEQLSSVAVRRTPGVVAYSPKTGALTEVIPGDGTSVGPLALADYDGDGSLDLFVGGRVIPGGYPLPLSSHLYRSVNGTFVPDTANDHVLSEIGMVSAAQFADINGDGWPDLILAIEWSDIRVLLNDHGQFHTSSEPGLDGVASRWNGVATGDLDGDGRLDIVATSWGRNNDLEATAARPLYMYFGLFGPGGRPNLLLAQEDPRIKALAPLEPFLDVGAAIPGAAERLGIGRASCRERV